MNHLSLVTDLVGKPAEGKPLNVSHALQVQPQRPGELCAELYVDVTPTERDRIEGVAADEGVPTNLWATLAIEAERSILCVGERCGLGRGALIEVADGAATEPPPAVLADTQIRMEAYAAALVGATARPPESRIGTLALRPAHALSIKWTIAASRHGPSLSEWLRGSLLGAHSARLPWEAAAACRGCTLEEWLAYAVLRSRSRSAVAQARS